MNDKPKPRDAKGPVEFDKRDRNRDGVVDEEELVDFESEQSFPASDPPSWTLGSDKGGSS